LDNLPLVVPIRRSDQENAVVYQHGFHVGLKGQYAGVSSWFIKSVLIIIIDCWLALTKAIYLSVERRSKTFYPQSLNIYCQISQRFSVRFSQDCWVWSQTIQVILYDSMLLTVSEIIVCFLILRLGYFNESSVKHQYDGEWKNENMRLTTCDPHARRAVTSSDSPQVIEDKKDVIFTYDVAFEVKSYTIL